MISWYWMDAPDVSQPLVPRANQDGGVTVTIPRDNAAGVVWAYRPDKPETPVVMGEFQSWAEVDVWMTPYRAFATLERRDNPALAWTLYHAAMRPDSASNGHDAGDTQSGSSTSVHVVPLSEPEQPAASVSPVESPPERAVGSQAVTPPAEAENQASVPVKRSIWSDVDVPLTSPAAPTTIESASLGTLGESSEVSAPKTPVDWVAGWVLPAHPTRWALWRFRHGQPEWWRSDHALRVWPSLEALMGADDRPRPVFWTPANALNGRRSSDRASLWYVAQWGPSAFGLWRPDDNGPVVFADRRHRLVIADDWHIAVEIGQRYGQVAVFSPSAIWMAFLHAEWAEIRRPAPSMAFNQP